MLNQEAEHHKKTNDFQGVGRRKTHPKIPRMGTIKMPKASSRNRPSPRWRPVAWQWNSDEFRISFEDV